MQCAAFLVLTGALVSVQLTVPAVGEWLERIQLLAAVMASALVTFVGWLVVTLAFGRLYCSTVCPVATMLDGFARLPRRGCRRFGPRRYRFARPVRPVAYAVLVVVLVCLMGGYAALPALVDPGAVWERMCRDCIAPVWGALGGDPRLSVEPGVWDTAAMRVAAGTLAGVAVSLVTLVALAVTAWRRGRLVCNTVCPVGTTLGFVSRYSILQIDIDTDLCVQCGRCADVCKSECIDLTDHTVDSSRCVLCFDCLEVCPNNAIRYTARRKQLSLPMMQSIKGPAAGAAAGSPTATASPSSTPAASEASSSNIDHS